MRYRLEESWIDGQLSFVGYVHDILSYRYHWHDNFYEIDIILKGQAEFSNNGVLYTLHENDMILINPDAGHASLALQPGTIGMVLRFSPELLHRFVDDGSIYHFHCVSNQFNQNDSRFKQLRFYAASLVVALYEEGQLASFTSKAALEMMISVLCNYFDPVLVKSLLRKEDERNQKQIDHLMAYIEENYIHKITLKDLAQFSSYNRTYLSTFFKENVGMNFYEYLTRIRFQHAVHDLCVTSKNLTEIAIGNGFPDLKTFNSRFRITFGQTPAEYRLRIVPEMILPGFMAQKFHNLENPMVKNKLTEYLSVF